MTVVDSSDSYVVTLVARARGRDGDAWDELVGRYVALVWSITHEFRLTEPDAADVVQTTWLRLLENIDRIERPERIASWIATTARRECLRHVRQRKRTVPVDEMEVFEGPADVVRQPEAVLIQRERSRQVRDAVAQLPERWRELVELRATDPPMPYGEVSERLSMPIGSIGPTLGRCFARLRELLPPDTGVTLPVIDLRDERDAR